MKKLVFVLFILAIFSFGAQTLAQSKVDSLKIDSVVFVKQAAPDTAWPSNDEPYIYPNPFSNVIHFNIPGEGKTEVKIFDLFSGRIVYDKSFEQKETLDTKNWRGKQFVVYMKRYDYDGNFRGTLPRVMLYRH